MRSAFWVALGFAAASGPMGGRVDGPPLEISAAASPLLPKLCVPEPDETIGVLRCSGLVGTDVFIGGARQQSVALGMAVFQADPPEGAVLGRSVNWRIWEGRPLAGIVRYDLPEEGGGASYFVVIKPGRKDQPGCVVGVLGQTAQDGLSRAAEYADRRSVSFRCGADTAGFEGASSGSAGRAMQEWVDRLHGERSGPKP